MKTFDYSIIRSYLIRTYGQNLINAIGRTIEEEEKLSQENKDCKFFHLLPTGDFKEAWEYKLPIYMENGLSLDVVQKMRNEIVNEIIK